MENGNENGLRKQSHCTPFLFPAQEQHLYHREIDAQFFTTDLRITEMPTTYLPWIVPHIQTTYTQGWVRVSGLSRSTSMTSLTVKICIEQWLSELHFQITRHNLLTNLSRGRQTHFKLTTLKCIQGPYHNIASRLKLLKTFKLFQNRYFFSLFVFGNQKLNETIWSLAKLTLHCKSQSVPRILKCDIEKKKKKKDVQFFLSNILSGVSIFIYSDIFHTSNLSRPGI